jgi:hypothetical protein
MNLAERQRLLRDIQARQEVTRWEIRTRRICEERLIALARKRVFGRSPTVEEFDAWQRSPEGRDAVLEVMRSINDDPAIDFCFPSIKSVASRWPIGTMWQGVRVK